MSMRIFLIEDAETDRLIFEKALTDAGYDVICIRNLADIVGQAIEHQPELVITDLFMPDKDGLQVTRELKSHPNTHHIPVIFISSTTRVSDVIDSMHIGVLDFIPKPIPVKDFVKNIRMHELVYSLKKEWGELTTKTRLFAEKYNK